MNTEQRIYRLEKMVQYLRCNNNGGGGTSIHNNLQGLQGGQPGQYYHLTQEQYDNLGGIQSIQEGDNISIDNTDPLNPIISATGGGGTAGNYIPLTGTEEGKPVTGDIEFMNDGEIIRLKQGTNSIVFDSDENSIRLEDTSDINNSYQLVLTKGGFDVAIISDGINANFDLNTPKGLSSNEYYGANYDDNTYIQKKYADQQHSYSTTETLTGGTWIDGKPIYKKYITVDIPANNSNPVGHLISNTVIIDFEKAYLKTLESDYAHAHGKGDNSIYDWSFSKNATNGQLLVAPKTVHTTIRTVSGVLFYTKTTD